RNRGDGIMVPLDFIKVCHLYNEDVLIVKVTLAFPSFGHLFRFVSVVYISTLPQLSGKPAPKYGTHGLTFIFKHPLST
ncbi:hypothetical protein, partial [uncultured Duncaniella sp.]|uniref:hypothetical protein n=1 Tax=uncultured Duncaniella sp. TaxID=2768039 RepID=UPI0026073495